MVNENDRPLLITTKRERYMKVHGPLPHFPIHLLIRNFNTEITIKYNFVEKFLENMILGVLGERLG